MRKHFGLVPVLLSLLAVATPAPAVAASSTHVPTITAARFGARSFSRPRYAPRSRYPSSSYRRSYRRVSPFRGLGGGILKALGIAYLVHAIFGWGAGGGSPFGLLLLVAIVAYVVGRARSRRPRWPAY